MSLTLYDALVPNWLQILGSVSQLVDKADAACAGEEYYEGDILEARLIEDMLPFAYQVKSCWVHSALALESCKTGHFSPHMAPAPDSLGGLRDLIVQAINGLEAWDAEELNAIAGNDMVFTIGDKLRMEFTVQNFLFGFSQPNLFFHAATTYNLLRMHGLQIGKRDFLGALPLKG
ncbi:DUF1993 family protein [Porphyrobacter algicida]|uniref:DUF1993 family protein n=1 Tax=Qipengyuania algicida TaxID=1836209 RepID=A0A845ALH4_9SPHN|nr:DUF1993 domain-containing protein [Qipengyuania algicida]MXP30013.1 DUF1993 family protein [Qipengyuania algicida]